ncbi:MAG TPA: hypothetical protein VES97_01650, partial [Solirubrobacteraceae bacterium]|nr:hypothetical protein [Solirubrobacteraceae bacterium]
MARFTCAMSKSLAVVDERAEVPHALMIPAQTTAITAPRASWILSAQALLGGPPSIGQTLSVASARFDAIALAVTYGSRLRSGGPGLIVGAGRVSTVLAYPANFGAPIVAGGQYPKLEKRATDAPRKSDSTWGER